MENIDKNILEWEEKFNKYLDFESKCNTNINAIIEIKNNLKKLLGNQKKDDVQFYKSLIDNSYFYLNSSLKIRKIKFLKDINYIWAMIDERKMMDEINRSNFSAMLKDYRKLSDDIINAKKNNTSLNWVKDDKIENLTDVERELNEIMEYHLKLIEFFHSSVMIEKTFYCGK